MFFDVDFATQFVTGAAAGLGHTFGQRFLPWLANTWGWWRGRPTASVAALSAAESLLRKVTLPELSKGIPAGYQLCRFRGDVLVEQYIDSLPSHVGADESLWLVPDGDVWLPAEFTAGDTSAEAEVAVAFDPADGLASLLTDHQQLSRGWLGALVAGGLMGVLTSFGKRGAQALLAGDPATTSGCRDQLSQALKDRGLRCTGLRGVRERLASPVANAATATTVAGDPGHDDTALDELAADLAQVRNSGDWDRLVQSLKAAGVPVDVPAAKQLDAIRDDLLQKAISAPQTVSRLGQLTAEAFERAGIEQPDLRRWQTVSDRLRDDAPEPVASVTAAEVAVGVAKVHRPSTWLVWSRLETDRRQLHYTRRAVRSCRVACDQALASLRDLPALRQVRDLNSQLVMIEELLDTMPPLEPQTASLKIDKQTMKMLLRSLEDAVLTTERLAQETGQLFAQTPSTEGWQQALNACLRSASQLTQLVRDRRTVR